MHFFVGDRVEYIDNRTCTNSNISIGSTGTVVLVFPEQIGSVGVRWDTFIDGHSCGDTCPYGYGWYVIADTLRLIEEKEYECDTDALNEMLFGGV